MDVVVGLVIVPDWSIRYQTCLLVIVLVVSYRQKPLLWSRGRRLVVYHETWKKRNSGMGAVGFGVLDGIVSRVALGFEPPTLVGRRR